MGRYTGPVCRLCRQVGDKLYLKGDRCYTPKCSVEKRRRPPGVQRPSRRRPSDYSVRLREKQKVRYTYGIREGQFLRNMNEAQRQPGITGQYLLQLLERRLDNVVYRSNFADSRNQSRQFVRHGHITVNGKKVDIPSFIVRAGDVIGWKPVSGQREFAQNVKASGIKRVVPRWLDVNHDQLTGRVVSLPETGDIDVTVDTRLIVEFYSR
ncbi:MAG: 30S ribosomal protein S4 [Chloroflexi bacterium]|nr:30S ribosomal protein S4 [Chloroflexota bacterium]